MVESQGQLYRYQFRSHCKYENEWNCPKPEYKENCEWGMEKETEKVVRHQEFHENQRLWDLYQSERPSLNSLQINAGEDVEKR